MFEGITILPERKITMRFADAEAKLKKLFFILSLYPDLNFAANLIGEKCIVEWLKYWIGNEQYKSIINELDSCFIKERHYMVLQELPKLYEIISYLWELQKLDIDYKTVFDHMLKKEEEIYVPFIPYEIKEEELPSTLSYENLVENLEKYIDIARKNPYKELYDGDYLVLFFNEILTGSRLQPMLIIARKINDNEYSSPVSCIRPLNLINQCRIYLPIPYYYNNTIIYWMNVSNIQRSTGEGKKLKYHKLIYVKFTKVDASTLNE
jgi:hypothetical protein